MEYRVKLFKNNDKPYRLFAVDWNYDVIYAELVDDKPTKAGILPRKSFYDMLSAEGWETDYNAAFTFNAGEFR